MLEFTQAVGGHGATDRRHTTQAFHSFTDDSRLYT